MSNSDQSITDGSFNLVKVELQRARSKFHHWPTDPLHAVGVVNEEVGELNQAILQEVYEPAKQQRDHVLQESIQAAAMAIRFLDGLLANKYKFNHSDQFVDWKSEDDKGGCRTGVTNSAKSQSVEIRNEEIAEHCHQAGCQMLFGGCAGSVDSLNKTIEDLSRENKQLRNSVSNLQEQLESIHQKEPQTWQYNFR